MFLKSRLATHILRLIYGAKLQKKCGWKNIVAKNVYLCKNKNTIKT